MQLRNVKKLEVMETIRTGEEIAVKKGRRGYRKNFQYNDYWCGRFYHIKQVMPIILEERNQMIVVTVYAFYF